MHDASINELEEIIRQKSEDIETILQREHKYKE